ncbi:MAG: hypothetical protein SOY43_11145 [Parabacteroides sp.]|nr:hypothetical protein [bacterium]MDY4103414.1 hypothetical protein [Parabacteroides sp.]
MKQRLLLALLVLFASVGTMWGADDATITIPGGVPAVTISYSKTNESGKTGTVKFYLNSSETALTESSSSTVTITPSSSEQSVTVTLTDVASVGLTVNGQVKGITLSNAKFTSLEVKNNNQKLGSDLSLTGASLTSLIVNECGLTSLPTEGFATNKAVTVNVKNNQIDDLSKVNIIGRTADAKLTYYLDGNKITKLSSAPNDNVVFNYGTQVVDKSASVTDIVANNWYKISDKLFTDIAPLSGLETSQASVSWKQNNVNVSILNQNGWEYKFFSGSKYLQGAITCTVTPDRKLNLPTYAISFNINPAQFKLKQAPSTAGDVAGNSLSITNKTDHVTADDAGMVCDGDVLLFSPTANAAKGYTFKGYEVSGLVKTNDANEYKVSVTDKTVDVVSVEALFEQKTFTVTVSKTGNGMYEVVDADKNPVSLTSKIPYGTTLYVKATPDAGYSPLVSVNNHVINPEGESSTYAGYYMVTVTANINISIKYEASNENPQLIIPENANISNVIINGALNDISSSQKKVSVKKGNTVIVEVTAKTGYKVTEIILDGIVLSNKNTAEFTMPETDAILTFTVVKAENITIIPGTNEFVYDGTEKVFQFETVPADLTGFTLKYATSATGSYTETKPKSHGTYYVQITRSADALYSKVDQKYNAGGSAIEKKLIMEIAKADPKITSSPSVTVNTDYTYRVIGGSATPAGKWTVVKKEGDSYKEVSVCDKTTSHLVSVLYTPTDNNYNTSVREVPVTMNNKPVETMAISWNKVPSGMTFTVMNGDQEITNGTKVAEGTTLTLKLDYPAGYDKVIVLEDNADATPVLDDRHDSLTGTSGTPAGSGPKTLTNKNYQVNRAVNFKFSYDGGEVAKSTPKIELKKSTDASTLPKYDGSVKTVATSGTSGYYINWNTPSSLTSTVQLKITYKQGTETVVSPVNAGKYTVCVHIPEFVDGTTTYAATDVEFKDAFVIAKATPTVVAWPDKAMLGVGQPLSQAKFIGGQVDVAGAFAFVDGTIVPEADKEYSVKFVPANTNNYEEVTIGGNPSASKTLSVTVSDKRIVTLEAMVGGSVVVKDKATNKEYKSGDELPSAVKEIIITAVPNTGYKLETLTVNGSAFTSGSSYTLGTTSVTIGATFYQEFTVSVSTSLKGIQLVLPTSNVVKKGGSYSFNVKGLAADLAKLVVSDGTNKYTVSNGACTIANITANKTITVTMASGATPTPIDLTKIAEVVNSHMGKPMGTIQVEVISATRAASTTAYYGDKIKLTATPAAGCQFVKWIGAAVPASQATANPLTIELTSAAYEITAEFAGSPTGAEVIEGVDIYGSNGEIVVKCDGAARITIVSMNGQSKQQEISGDTRIPAGAGIYGIVFEQGNHVMRTKVAVK